MYIQYNTIGNGHRRDVVAPRFWELTVYRVIIYLISCAQNNSYNYGMNEPIFVFGASRVYKYISNSITFGKPS